jgi:hypothetical protein
LLQRAEYLEKEKETDDEHDDGNNHLAGGTILQLALFVDRYRSARRAGNHFRCLGAGEEQGRREKEEDFS